ncbi:MAG: hypothetical protein PUJ09_08905 [Eubacteriales bacterium]|nr:hypothetical protein [Eubacteriales bacterium]
MIVLPTSAAEAQNGKNVVKNAENASAALKKIKEYSIIVFEEKIGNADCNPTVISRQE